MPASPEKADDSLPGSVRSSATTTRVGFPPERRLGYPGRDARSENGSTVSRARARTAWFLATEGGRSRLKSRVRERGPRGTKGLDVPASHARRLARRFLVEPEVDGVDDAVEGKLG
jgi:hypothetical protein